MTHANIKLILASFSVGLPLLVLGVAATATPVAAAVAAPTAYAQQAQDPTASMPDGPGKAEVIATCTKCHSITNVTTQHKDNDGWTATITKMVGYGAVGSDEDFQNILTYLTKNYGPDAPAAK